MRISDWSSDVCSSDLVSIPRTTSSEGSVSASAGRVMAPDLTLSGSDWLCFPERPPERPPVGGFLSMPHALKLGAMSAKPLLRLGTRGSPLALAQARSEEHTSELQSLMRISYAVFCLKKKTQE